MFTPEVGQIVAPADGSRYRGRVTYVSKEEDTVKHTCLRTGNVFEKSYFGFQVRYNPVVMTCREAAQKFRDRADKAPYESERHRCDAQADILDAFENAPVPTKLIWDFPFLVETV